jgi:hypothetical protein
MVKDEKSTSLTVRFPPRLYEAIKQLAKAERRSINGQIIFMLQHGTPGLGEIGENVIRIIEKLRE